MERKSPLTLCRVAVLVAVGALAVLAHRSMQRYEDQINNLELFKAYARALEEYERANDSFPATLEALERPLRSRILRPLGKDHWGNPIHYESRGHAYVLVSLGRDGHSDGLDAWDLREADVKQRICGDVDADQVRSDRGFHRACFK